MNACTSQTSILNQVKESFKTNLSDSQKELITNQTAYEDLKAVKTNEIKVHLFQHGDFSGWKVQFGIDSFHLAGILKITLMQAKTSGESFETDLSDSQTTVPLVFRLDEGSSSSTCLERDTPICVQLYQLTYFLD